MNDSWARRAAAIAMLCFAALASAQDGPQKLAQVLRQQALMDLEPASARCAFAEGRASARGLLAHAPRGTVLASPSARCDERGVIPIEDSK